MRVCVKLVPCVKFNADVFCIKKDAHCNHWKFGFLFFSGGELSISKKMKQKKVFFVFAFDAPVSMMTNLLVSVSLFLSLALSLIVFLF